MCVLQGRLEHRIIIKERAARTTAGFAASSGQARTREPTIHNTRAETPMQQSQRTSTHGVVIFACALFIPIACVFILTYWRAIFMPIVLAVMVWYLINAMAHAYTRVPFPIFRHSKKLGLLLSICTVFLVGLGLFQLTMQSIGAAEALYPTYEQKLDALLVGISTQLHLEKTLNISQLLDRLDLSSVASFIASRTAGIVFTLLMVFFYVIFLLMQQRYFHDKVALIVGSEERAASVDIVFRKINKEIRTYIGVMAFLAVITGLFTFVVLWWLGMDFAVLLSVVVALFSFIPTLGTAFGIVVPSLMALLQFDSYSPFFVVVISLGTMQIVFNNYLQPKLMGRSMNLSPFLILVSLAVWGWIWGITGAVLCIPITVSLMIVFAQFETTRPIAVLLSMDGKLDAGQSEP
ncbi:AI-2E family transporter [Oceanidesulfovibrio marinus]|uniref:AI-2E family transporter n=2 Tax=Oceanidesulfovibrio marinus TaxID=370038 RepID=A0ABX6NG24_9BACT|nr:AI-2E family transporter [Oceanidesulfovibrio marinus]